MPTVFSRLNEPASFSAHYMSTEQQAMDVSKEFKSIESLNDHVAKEHNNRVQGIRGHETGPGRIRLQKHTTTYLGGHQSAGYVQKSTRVK